MWVTSTTTHPISSHKRNTTRPRWQSSSYTHPPITYNLLTLNPPIRDHHSDRGLFKNSNPSSNAVIDLNSTFPLSPYKTPVLASALSFTILISDSLRKSKTPKASLPQFCDLDLNRDGSYQADCSQINRWKGSKEAACH